MTGPARDGRTGVGTGGRRSTRGQAAVELVAVTPLVVAVTAGVVTALLALATLVVAEHALGRGVVAAAAGGDAARAVRAALPGRIRADARIRLEGDVLHLRIDLPGVAPVVELEAPLPAHAP